MEDYLTIKEAIDNGIFKNSTIIAGKNGINNKARSMVILETPDGVNWLKGNEIVLTAGVAFKYGNMDKNEFLKIAKNKGAAAIGIKIGRYFGEIDNSLIYLANQLNIPVFILEREVYYTDIISDFYEALFNKKSENLLKANSAYNSLVDLQMNNSTIDDIVNQVSKLIKEDVFFYRFHEYQPQDEVHCYEINHHEALGYLVVNTDEKLNEFQMGCIKYAITIIKNNLLIEQNKLISESIINRMIAEIILSDVKIDTRFYYTVLSYLKWGNNGFYGLYFKWLNKEYKSNAKIRKIIEYSEDVRFLFSTDDDGMIIFLPIKKCDIVRLFERIKRAFPNDGADIKLGISTNKKDLGLLKEAYLESKSICNNHSETISFIDEFQDEKIFLNLLEYRDIRLFLSTNIIKKIKMYDECNNSQLFMTINEYIGNNKNNRITSERLHIHVETLRYRLKKIKELTGYDVNKSEDFMFLVMAIKLDRYL